MRSLPPSPLAALTLAVCIASGLQAAEATREVPVSTAKAVKSDWVDPAVANVEAVTLTQGEWVFAPIPSRSPGMGWSVAAPLARLYHPRWNNPASPPWITGAGAFYSSNGSWGVGALQSMNLFQDHWRFDVAGGYGDIKYDYYGVGGGAGNDEAHVEINQRFTGGVLSFLGETLPGLYLGLKLVPFVAEIKSVTLPLAGHDFEIPLPGLQSTVVGLEPRAVYDTRDNTFYPRSGSLAEFGINLNSETWGSDFQFQIYNLEWNQYHALGARQVLAFRFVGQYAAGDVPFFLMPTLGQGSDLRGYTTGVYRDRILLATQLEYRWRFSQRWGLVAFAGLGSVAHAWSEIDEALPSVGTGLRWVIAKANDVSLRADVAWGKHSSQFYISVGEAF